MHEPKTNKLTVQVVKPHKTLCWKSHNFNLDILPIVQINRQEVSFITLIMITRIKQNSIDSSCFKPDTNLWCFPDVCTLKPHERKVLKQWSLYCNVWRKTKSEVGDHRNNLQGCLEKSLKWLLINYQILLPNFLIFTFEWLGEFNIASKVT